MEENNWKEYYDNIINIIKDKVDIETQTEIVKNMINLAINICEKQKQTCAEFIDNSEEKNTILNSPNVYLNF